jgi:hypothetical protein
MQAAQQHLTRLGAWIYQQGIPLIAKALVKCEFIWESITPYHPEHLATILIGFTLVYFGGSFMTIVAAVEAYRITCWEDTIKQIKLLKDNFYKVLEASKVDDLKDDNHDGVADVKQISKEELFKRKTALFFSTIEPIQVYSALGNLYVGFLAVIATLKVKFAHTITLGSSIGEMVFTNVNPFAQPILKKILPEEYQKWAPVIINYLSKSFGVLLAWTLQRAISAFYSALRGTVLLAQGIKNWLLAVGIWKDQDQNTNLNQFAKVYAAGIILTGVWHQISHGFSLPFPLNIILFPVTLLEYALLYLTNS